MKTIEQFLELELIHIGNYVLTIGSVFTVAFTFFTTVFLLWIIKKALFRKKVLTKYERGNLYSLFQIIKYIVWIIAVLICLEVIGVKINALLAGSAALLVGIGLGLQNTFNDFVSGIILLFEGTVKVGDVLDVDGDVVKIERIGLRTSTAVDRFDVHIIIPNSIITSNKMINWSHQTKKTRFSIKVGVAYGSDVELVMRLLQESALEHPKVTDVNDIIVRFNDFGNSSLDFELLFFCKDTFGVENIKSEIRILIDKKFREHKITIPFPQMDVYLKK